MAASVQEIGLEKNRVLVVDDFMDEPYLLIEQARAMAPFPSEDVTYYPGLRRLITPADADTELHVNESLEALAPLIGQVFGLKSFMPTEASFSLVTRRPGDLNPAQRLPHFDKTDPDFLAVLHYLSPRPQGGTSFYRHRSTGFERIAPDREPIYAMARDQETARSGDMPARYFSGSDGHFERIGRFEAKFNRLLIYRGSLLHSGDIPDDFTFSSDPAVGRLTCNIFLQGD